MYVEPNSTVELYRGVDLDRDYNNTYHYLTTSERDEFFDTHYKTHTFTAYSYQRVKRGYIDLKAKYSEVYLTNYMRFKNNSYENRWFYAFVMSCEYINNETTRIHYNLDVMTTWANDYGLMECLVERQHSTTDEIGDNIVPETIKSENYVCSRIDKMIGRSQADLDRGEWSLIVAATFDKNYTKTYAWYYTDKNVSGLTLNAFDANYNGAQQMIAFLRGAEDRNLSDGIVTIFYFPKWFVIQPGQPGQIIKNVSHTKPYAMDFDGYTPKNKKLYTYPYCKLEINSPDGGSSTFAYEYFKSDNDKMDFQLRCSYTTNTEMQLIPLNYYTVEGTVSSIEPYHATFAIPMRNFPLVSWNNDMYRQWLAYNTNVAVPSALAKAGVAAGIGAIASTFSPAIMSTATALGTAVAPGVGTIAGAAIGGALLAGGSSLLNSAVNEFSSGLENAIKPPENHGSQCSLTAIEAGMYDYYMRHWRVNRDTARSIDDFFTMFGYAMKRIMMPNRNARERWTYIKTTNCEINNMGIPQEDVEIIRSVYNKGVTFWRTNTLIGDYTQSNNPLGG